MKRSREKTQSAGGANSVLAAIALCMLSACASIRGGDDAPIDCSGIPGDMHTPAAMDAAAAATHGPGAPGVVERLVAARSPSLDVPLPALYVFGPEAEYLSHPARAPDVLSADPVFETLREQAYWGEVVDDRFYWVPWLGQCEIADVLGRPVAMRAPKGGLLFLQFLKPDCTQCRDATAAIERLIVARPDLPVRWVQVEVPARLRRPKE